MSRDDARRALIAYDVADDARRLKVAGELLKYGDRVQYSVFVVDCSPTKLIRLENRLLQLIEPDADSLLFCDLGLLRSVSPATFRYVGRRRHITSDMDLII